MKRLARVEHKGWKVVMFMSGRACQAIKGTIRIQGSSITNLHKQIFGY